MTSLAKRGREKEQMLLSSIQILSYNESEALRSPQNKMPVDQPCPTFLPPGIPFMEDSFFTDKRWGYGFRMILTHYIYWALYFIVYEWNIYVYIWNVYECIWMK